MLFVILGPFAAANSAIFIVLPQFYSKNGQKEMLQICPVSVCSRSVEITQNWLETAVPSLFFTKSDWD